MNTLAARTFTRGRGEPSDLVVSGGGGLEGGKRGGNGVGVLLVMGGWWAELPNILQTSPSGSARFARSGASHPLASPSGLLPPLRGGLWALRAHMPLSVPGKPLL